jgi:TRAP-type mannitol/chloroaromatic compound transport system permease small subunit
VTLRWPAIAVLVALALLFLGAVSSIIKAISVRRDRPSSDHVPESDYYKVDIDEGEKRARGERRD